MRRGQITLVHILKAPYLCHILLNTRTHMRKYIAVVSLLCFGQLLSAQDMVYEAKNPNFGGQTFNYQVLLSGAQAQNSYSNPNAISRTSSSTLDDFQSSLDRQVLSTLSRQIVNNQFGEDALEPGNYTFGNFSVDISNSIDGLLVDIVDVVTGETTQVLVPFF